MNMKYKITLGIVAVLILAGIGFFIFHRPNLLWSQKPPAPGSYITKKQLANVGYSTPEATLETVTWAMMNANYDKTIEAFAPEMQTEMKKDPNDRKQFESAMKRGAPSFKGMQIVAKKTIANDKVDLKYFHEITRASNPDSKYRFQVMVKIGSEWKLGGGTRGGFMPDWDNSSNIVVFVAQ
jgi:hypothetical protein